MATKVKNTKAIVWCGLAFLTVILGTLIWNEHLWGRFRSGKGQPSAIATPSIGSVREIIISKGTVAYDHQLGLRSRVSGWVTDLAVHEGSEVRRGQRLLRILDSQEDIDLESRELEQQRAQTKLHAVEKDLAAVRRLVELGGLARYDIDQKTLERDMAVNDIERAKLEISRLGEKRALSLVKSPLDGLVLSMPVAHGQWVNAGDELLSLAGGDGRYVVAYIDAMDVERVRIGQSVIFSDQEDSGRPRKGRVKEIGRAVTSAQRQNSVKIVVEPFESIRDLRVSQQLYVEFVVLEEAAVLRIPRELVYVQGDRQFVYVVTEKGVSTKPIQTTRGDASFDKVISGVSITDQLVRKGSFSSNAP